MKKFYDLHLSFENNENIAKAIELSEKFGFSGICIAKQFEKNFSEFSESVKKLSSKTKIEVFIGAEISENIKRNAVNALKFSDFIIANCRDEKTKIEASKCWEVDILYQNINTKNHMDQKNSGVDSTIATLLSERGIALEINFSEFLNSYGSIRAKKIGKVRQNILIARKYKTPIIITSGAKDIYEMRTPRELISFGKILGLNDHEVKDALERTPLRLIEKSNSRKDPKKILKGLEILKFGEEKKIIKKMHGFY